jgi:hypothetical protein
MSLNATVAQKCISDKQDGISKQDSKYIFKILKITELKPNILSIL